MDNLEKRLASLINDINSAWTKLNIDEKIHQIENLEVVVSQPNLWTNPDNARAKTTELSNLESEVHPWQILKTQASDLSEILSIKDNELLAEATTQLEAMETELKNLQKALRFTGPHDHNNAILRITAGVGGVEAMDWASMLERMYLRFLDSHNFKYTLLERSVGEEAGIKTAVYEITGKDAYGTLKSENGVHRLVRLSPFNADNLRQTSFALVEILPVITDNTDIKIDEKDLRIDVYHSGGHGGQSVNTTNSAVRITHLPTNTVVAIQNERSQLQNKEKALEILRGKLAKMKEDQKAETLADLRAGESAKWGQQIRNYVLQPYKLVKDTRTKHEETDAESVLNGKIDPFIDAYLDSIQ